MRPARLLALLPALFALASPIPAAASPTGPILNDWDCLPSPAHPRPVVLLHGIADGLSAWHEVAAKLTDRGVCVFATEYGKDPRTFNQLNGFAPMAQSLDEVSAFTEQVRQRTGAAQVDLVGHSEGGALALALSRRLGGPAVHTVVLLAPPTHGTTLSGLVDFATRAAIRPVTDAALRELVCPACADLETSSEFIGELSRQPITAPGVRYAILALANDPIVSPGGAASFVEEPSASNDLAENLWPGEHFDHATLPQHSLVADWVVDHLTS
ncbi:alpha/beta fold hydrolase [Nocardia inohanensis]|uniref:alpha/beta fold hydrolase n=1 Tax=Nocardia inohanensis TaxID=209246 RepID=UPI00082EF9E4|nr:alpha/beta fold hydrolase [Nocardia inohanensis]